MGANSGSLLLGATDQAIGLVDRFAHCFVDSRIAERVVHDVRTLLGQRRFGIALGDEDVIDHDELRYDPVLGPVLGKLEAARRFADFPWTTLDSWSRRRRVIAKAEWMPGHGERGANPRFIVTSLSAKTGDARSLYEQLYCARRDMENRIKECQLHLFADRTSAATMKANQLRLWFASMAFVLLATLRRIGLKHTRLAKASCASIRLKLLKIGAQVRVSVRRIRVAMESACSYASEFTLAHMRLCR